MGIGDDCMKPLRALESTMVVTSRNGGAMEGCCTRL